MVSWILLFVLAIRAVASPDPQPLLLSGQASFVLPMIRERLSQVGGNPDVFNPRYMRAKKEIPKVLAKYKDAHNILPDINLNPPSNISLGSVSQSGVITDQPASPIPPPVLSTAHFAQMPLNDFISGDTDIMYTGSVKIGTPPQELLVDIDTGSSDLWVMSDCTGCRSSENQFNSKASSTYSQSPQGPFGVTYGTGSITADRGTDVVSVQGLSVTNQSFGAATKVTDDFVDYPMSGILGMAFSSIAQSGQPTFFENLWKGGQTGGMFAVHLERLHESGSEVCLGCYNPSKMTGMISWIPVISQTYWTLGLGGLSVNQGLVSTSGVFAAIDTGTTYIYLPESLTKKFYDLIPASKPLSSTSPGIYTIPCNSTSTVALVFSSISFAISTADFNLGPVASGSSDCIGGIFGMSDGFPDNLAIIGDEFLKNWYSLYDYENGVRVGFARSINNDLK